MAPNIVKIEKSFVKNLSMNIIHILIDPVEFPSFDIEACKDRLLCSLKCPGKFIYFDISEHNGKKTVILKALVSAFKSNTCFLSSASS